MTSESTGTDLPLAARAAAERIAETIGRLERESDIWLATASDTGPWLVPLWFLWWDGGLVLATPSRNRTARNITGRPNVQLALTSTEDVVLIDGTATARDIGAVDAELIDAYRAKYDVDDPRTWTDTVIDVRPQRVRAWRGEHELPGREIMRDGHWLGDPA